jgi:hypothetical protein
MLTQFLDITYTLATHPQTAGYVASFSPWQLAPHLGDIARLSTLCNLVGAALALPAIVTGAVDLTSLLSRQAVADKIAHADGAKGKVKTAAGTHPKVKIAFAHALLMDATVAALGYGWWIRKDNVLGAPGIENAVIAAGSLIGLGVGSFLGGRLVYRHGVGVYSAGVLQGKKDL